MWQQWQEAYNRGDLRAVADFYGGDARHYATDGRIDEDRQAAATARHMEPDELERQISGKTFAMKIETRERQEVGAMAFEIDDHTVSSSDGQVVSHGSDMAMAKKVRVEWRITRHMATGVLPIGVGTGARARRHGVRPLAFGGAMPERRRTGHRGADCCSADHRRGSEFARTPCDAVRFPAGRASQVRASTAEAPFPPAVTGRRRPPSGT